MAGAPDDPVCCRCLGERGDGWRYAERIGRVVTSSGKGLCECEVVVEGVVDQVQHDRGGLVHLSQYVTVSEPVGLWGVLDGFPAGRRGSTGSARLGGPMAPG